MAVIGQSWLERHFDLAPRRFPSKNLTWRIVMTERYWLLDSMNLRTIHSGDYHSILDAILYYGLNLGEYQIVGCEIPLTEVAADAESLRADLADRFDALLV